MTPVREAPKMSEAPNKIPEQVKYEPRPVPEMLKESLVDWLDSLHIIRKDPNIVQVIPSICRTGVLFCDLVNRLEGRTEVIKGIERNPKNRTQALANINKVLEYLRGMPKINSRYLWSGKEIVDGNEYVAWGLLEDIKNQAPEKKPKQTLLAPQLITPNVSVPVIKQPEKLTIPKIIQKEKSKSLRSYSSTMKKFSSKNSTVGTPRVSRPPSSRSFKSERVNQMYITNEMKKNVLAWIDALGIEYEPASNPYVDILKNGLLVCELLRIIFKPQSDKAHDIPVPNLYPKSGQAVYENFDRALTFFKSKRQELPSSIISDPEHMVNNPELVYTFLYALMSSYPQAAPIEYQPCLLPYGALGLRKLEFVVVNWIESLNILQPAPQMFSELIPELKKGVLLCVIASTISSIKIFNIVPEPKTDQSALNNIRKALDILRKLPRMSQKFTWSEKEILKGNNSVLLGLLEDILRWTDGLPSRKNGTEYHKEGPYLRPVEIKKNEETFNTTFGSSVSHKVQEKEIDSEKYTAWLYSIGAEFPRSINFAAEHIPEFTTGVLICNIVMALEKIRIPGIEREPKTRVSAIGNINKALVVLRKKSGFSKELFNCAEEVFLGDGDLIRRVLDEMMKIWG